MGTAGRVGVAGRRASSAHHQCAKEPSPCTWTRPAAVDKDCSRAQGVVKGDKTAPLGMQERRCPGGFWEEEPAGGCLLWSKCSWPPVRSGAGTPVSGTGALKEWPGQLALCPPREDAGRRAVRGSQPSSGTAALQPVLQSCGKRVSVVCRPRLRSASQWLWAGMLLVPRVVCCCRGPGWSSVSWAATLWEWCLLSGSVKFIAFHAWKSLEHRLFH